MRSQFYTTLLLAFAIQLDYFIPHADAEDLKKPEISVQNRGGEVDLSCQTKLKHLPSDTNVSCNLYIGDSSQPFRSTWTKHKDKVCIFIVKRDDLKQGLQSMGATEVSCDYSVPTDPRSPSPRSDKRKIEGLSPGTSTFSEADKKTTSPPAVTTKKRKLQKPDISVDAVQNTGVVNISCQTTLRNLTFVTNISCNLYIGDSSGPFRRTWTTNGVCTFCVNVKDLLKSRKVSCDYSVNIDPHSLSPRSKKVNIVGKLPTAELRLSPAVISIEESVKLRCSRPDSAPASHCTFTINQRREISGSECERKVTGAELLSGSHSARNEITMRCFYSLEEGGKPARHSDPSTVTVLDLRKPNISVSTEHTETHIRCEAPPDITGAIFYLYSNRSRTHSKSTQAGTEERAVSFTVPRSSDSTVTYCCRYQFETINSKLSDCAEAKNKDQSKTWLKTPAGIGVILTVIVILLGMTGACLYWIHRKRKSTGLPTTPNNDAVYTTVDVSKGAETSDATSPSDVTYSTVTHLAPQTVAFQAQQDNVVYSSLKTD